MRDRLAKRAGLRAMYRATFARYGVRYTFNHEIICTVLLRDVQTISGYLMTDHIWLSEDALFRKVGIAPGDKVQFVAGVEEYRRKRTNEMDYRLTRITRLRKV